MAIWQFDVSLMPDAIVPDAESYIAASVTDDGLDTEHWWRHNQPPSDFHATIESYFPRCDSWADDLYQWGAEKGILIRSWQDDAITIWARLAIPHLTPESIVAFCDCVSDLDCHIYVMETQAVVGPSPVLLQPHILESRAARFCSDPQKFFDEFDDPPSA